MEPSPGGRPPRRVEALLFALLALVYGWSYDPHPGPNAVAHVDQATAIALYGTLAIDRFVAVGEGRAKANTNDWARAPSGHFYPAKAPGTALAAVPLLAVLGRLERAAGLDPESDPLLLVNAHRLNLLLNVPASALCMVLLLRLSVRLGIPLRRALFGVVAVALGSAFAAYATSFYAHDFAANLIVAAAWCVLGGEDRRVTTARAAAAGALAGYAVVVDYPAAFGVIVIAGMLAALRPRSLAAYVAGGLAPLAVFAAYHASAFGSPFATAYSFHENPAFAPGTPSFHVPSEHILFELTVLPYRGLFFYSPALLLAAPGAVRAWHKGDLRLRALAAGALALLCLWLLINASFRGWWGGCTAGPRYVVPALPLLAPLVALGLGRLPRIGAALIAVSIANYLAITSVTLLALEFRFMRNPLFDGIYPALLHGVLGRANLGQAIGLEGLWSLAPMLLAGAALTAAIVRAVAVAERPRRALP